MSFLSVCLSVLWFCFYFCLVAYFILLGIFTVWWQNWSKKVRPNGAWGTRRVHLPLPLLLALGRTSECAPNFRWQMADKVGISAWNLSAAAAAAATCLLALLLCSASTSREALHRRRTQLWSLATWGIDVHVYLSQLLLQRQQTVAHVS